MASADQRSAAEIEAEIESERSALSKTLDEIQDRLSFETISNDVMGRIRENSGDLSRAVTRSVKENPIPLVLTAICIGWLIANQRSGSGAKYRGIEHDDLDDDAYSRYAARPVSARDTVGYRGGAAEPVGLYDAGGRPMPRDDDDDDDNRWDRTRAGLASARDRASASASSTAQSASDRARASRDAVQDRASGMAAGVSDRMYRSREEMQRRARGAYASASELRERMMQGTEGLSDAARRRVVAARTRAYEAQLRAEYYASRGRERAADLFEDQPLVAGALAMAVGAAIGGLLPRTRQEDDAFGAYRDQVFDEAERIYQEERGKIESVARETAKEARQVASETAESMKGDLKKAAESTGDIARARLGEAEQRAKEGADRVADTAKTEADKQNLGQQS
jgi:hypothetical protein